MRFLKWLKRCFCCCSSCGRKKRRKEDKHTGDSFTGPGPSGQEKSQLERRSQRTALNIQDFDFLAVLGQGGFGKVFLAEYRPRKTLLAVKTLRKAAVQDIRRLETEKRVLEGNTQRKHPFVIHLFGCFQTATHVAMAVEYAPGGDLRHYRQKKKRKPFKEPWVRFCVGCITLGLEHLHSSNIIYRDLKLDNLVINRDGYIKITDFGLCKEGIGYGDRALSRCGTPETIAPEIVNRKPYTRSVDWWSLGVVIYQLFTGKNPFDGDNLRLLANIITAPVKYPAALSEEAVSIMSQLMQKNPQARLGSGKRDAADVKGHLFFQEFAWEDLLQRRMTSPFGPVEKQHRLDPKSVRDISLLSSSAADALEMHFEGFSCIAEGALSISPSSQPPSLAPSSVGQFPPAASPPPSRPPSPASSTGAAPSLLEPSALSCSLWTDPERRTDCAVARAASLPNMYGSPSPSPGKGLRWVLAASAEMEARGPDARLLSLQLRSPAGLLFVPSTRLFKVPNNGTLSSFLSL
ncbi:serine/threonine-protein kinase N1-like [Elgaria multicarinata webbii]|uniref:serine/threonine-protein kinase N1-like n=1 Tax=Elgaria multicarinata webbii TaxID=159646 RepID=UPI002FCD0084